MIGACVLKPSLRFIVCEQLRYNSNPYRNLDTKCVDEDSGAQAKPKEKGP